MKKSLSALLLLGVALAVGADSTVRARGLERNEVRRDDFTFRVDLRNRLRSEQRERLSRDYAAFATRIDKDGRFEAKERDKADDRLASEERLRKDDAAGSIRDREDREDRAPGVADGERPEDSGFAPGDARSDTQARGDGGDKIGSDLKPDCPT